MSYSDLINYLSKSTTSKSPYIIAIDGKAGSGKTTLARQIQIDIGGVIIHMDDFFLPKVLQNEKRLMELGGNIHHERFKDEVIDRLYETIEYRVFSCKEQKYIERIKIVSPKIIIIEGSYSMHPSYGKYMDCSIFLKTSKEVQIKRLKKRNKDNFLDFINKWIPYEEKYFSFYDIENRCDFIIDTDYK